MDDIVLARSLRAQGLNSHDIAALRRKEELVRVRRGAYAREPLSEGGWAAIEAAHRRLVAGTVPLLEPGAVLSHGSAAVLHGLPVWSAMVERVHVTRERSGGGQRRSTVHVHGAPLRSGEITMIDGTAVTSLARTVADLGRTVTMERAVAAGDRALALGLHPMELQQVMLGMKHWPGVRRSRRAANFLDPRSESAGESVSRVRFVREGLPLPEPQQNIRGLDGQVVARVDFLWRAQRTVGEFDGKIKYGRLLTPGQSVEDVIFAEKVREDLLRDLGWQVVRWLWADLHRSGVIADRLRRAFARAA